MKRTSLFLAKHILTYAFIVLCFLALLVPMRNSVNHMARRIALGELQSDLDAGAARLSARTTRMIDEASILFSGSDAKYLSLYDDDNSYNDIVTSVLRVSQQLSGYTALQDDVLLSVMLFRNNTLCLSDSAIYADYHTMYQVALGYEDMDADAWRAKIMAARGQGSMWPDMALSRYSYTGIPRGVVTFVVPSESLSGSAQAVMAFLMDSDLLLKSLFPLDATNSSSLELLDADGHVLAQQIGKDEKSETLISKAGRSGFTLKMGVPERLLIANAQKLTATIETFIILGICLALFLSILTALWQLLPFRRLLKRVSVIGGPAVSGNGYQFIERAIDTVTQTYNRSEQRVALLQGVCHYNRLELACLRGVEAGEDAKQIDQFLGGAPYLVAVFRTRGASNDLWMWADEFLQTQAPALRRTALPMGEDETVFFLCDIPKERIPWLTDRLRALLMALSSQRACAASIGLSCPAVGAQAARTAYQQAWRAIRLEANDYQSEVYCYQPSYDSGDAGDALAAADKLSSLLLACDQEGIEQLLVSLRGEARGETEWMQLFYALRAALGDVEKHIGDPVPLPQWQARATVDEAMDEVMAAALKLCESMHVMQSKGNLALKKQIMSYIEESLPDAQLCAAMVADCFNIVEKYVYQLVKESTGEPFGAWVQRQRLQMAANLLTTTELANEEIARRSGFGAVNTFYRVFKKQYGVSPSVWRAMPPRQ